MCIVSLEFVVLILISRSYFLESQNCHAHLDFLREHHFGFRFDFLSSAAVRNSLWSSVVKRNESKPVWVFLFVISLQFTSYDKRFSTNFLSTLEASVLVRRWNIAPKSARFFRSRINVITLNILGLFKRNILVLSLSYLLNAVSLLFPWVTVILSRIRYSKQILNCNYIYFEIYQKWIGEIASNLWLRDRLNFFYCIGANHQVVVYVFIYFY